MKKLIGRKAVIVEYVANGQIRIRNYKHLVHFHVPEGENAQSQEEFQKYYNGPGDRSDADANKHLYHRILDDDMEADRDDFQRVDYAQNPTKIDLHDLAKNFLIEEDKDDHDHEIDDHPDDEFEDDYHEFIENVDLVNPYMEDDEDPRNKRDLADDWAKMLFPEEAAPKKIDDDEKIVVINERENRIVPNNWDDGNVFENQGDVPEDQKEKNYILEDQEVPEDVLENHGDAPEEAPEDRDAPEENGKIDEPMMVLPREEDLNDDIKGKPMLRRSPRNLKPVVYPQ